jgi:hypothetical protein
MAKYTLQDVQDITFNGFDIQLPESTIKLIQELTSQVGSPTYVKTPNFQKKDPTVASSASSSGFPKKKRVGNKGMEVKDSDWETLRTFHATKIEQKIGLDAEIDIVRSYLNKMTDKNYLEMKDNVINMIDKLIDDGISKENLLKLSGVIFDIASNNRFFSKLYAELYSELMIKYEIMTQIFDNSFYGFMELFSNIEHVDPEKDYDRFCKITKNNEIRKSLSTFFVNLCIKDVLSLDKIMKLIQEMLTKVNVMINEENKKNEVDEYTENVAILYNKELMNKVDARLYLINGEKIEEIIQKMACYKSKDYKSLSNKSIFKYMDIVEC